jgi:hypothetical protein
MVSFGPTLIRAVTHLDVELAAVRQAALVVAEALVDVKHRAPRGTT